MEHGIDVKRQEAHVHVHFKSTSDKLIKEYYMLTPWSDIVGKLHHGCPGV